MLLRTTLGGLRTLDRWNLLPRAAIENDPMHTSIFVANLGSIGLDDSYHHLYEHGTCSIFAALGTPKKTLFVARDGTAEVRDGLKVRWTLDERIADGFTAGQGLAWAKRVIEDPARHLGPPGEVASGAPPHAVRRAA